MLSVAPVVLEALACAAAKGYDGGPCCSRVLMSVACADTRDHMDIHGLCCHQTLCEVHDLHSTDCKGQRSHVCSDINDFRLTAEKRGHGNPLSLSPKKKQPK